MATPFHSSSRAPGHASLSSSTRHRPVPKTIAPRAPIHNPYDKFTQPEFDLWIGDITSALKRALGHEETPLSHLPPDHSGYLSTDDVPLETNLEPTENESDPAIEESFAQVKLRHAKGKARDPREGPGFGDRVQPIEVVSSDEEEEDQVADIASAVQDGSDEERYFDEESDPETWDDHAYECGQVTPLKVGPQRDRNNKAEVGLSGYDEEEEEEEEETYKEDHGDEDYDEYGDEYDEPVRPHGHSTSHPSLPFKRGGPLEVIDILSDDGSDGEEGREGSYERDVPQEGNQFPGMERQYSEYSEGDKENHILPRRADLILRRRSISYEEDKEEEGVQHDEQDPDYNFQPVGSMEPMDYDRYGHREDDIHGTPQTFTKHRNASEAAYVRYEGQVDLDNAELVDDDDAYFDEGDIVQSNGYIEEEDHVSGDEHPTTQLHQSIPSMPDYDESDASMVPGIGEWEHSPTEITSGSPVRMSTRQQIDPILLENDFDGTFVTPRIGTTADKRPESESHDENVPSMAADEVTAVLGSDDDPVPADRQSDSEIQSDKIGLLYDDLPHAEVEAPGTGFEAYMRAESNLSLLDPETVSFAESTEVEVYREPPTAQSTVLEDDIQQYQVIGDDTHISSELLDAAISQAVLVSGLGQTVEQADSESTMPFVAVDPDLQRADSELMFSYPADLMQEVITEANAVEIPLQLPVEAHTLPGPDNGDGFDQNTTPQSPLTVHLSHKSDQLPTPPSEEQMYTSQPKLPDMDAEKPDENAYVVHEGGDEMGDDDADGDLDLDDVEVYSVDGIGLVTSSFGYSVEERLSEGPPVQGNVEDELKVTLIGAHPTPSGLLEVAMDFMKSDDDLEPLEHERADLALSISANGPPQESISNPVAHSGAALTFDTLQPKIPMPVTANKDVPDPTDVLGDSAQQSHNFIIQMPGTPNFMLSPVHTPLPAGSLPVSVTLSPATLRTLGVSSSEIFEAAPHVPDGLFTPADVSTRTHTPVDAGVDVSSAAAITEERHIHEAFIVSAPEEESTVVDIDSQPNAEGTQDLPITLLRSLSPSPPEPTPAHDFSHIHASELVQAVSPGPMISIFGGLRSSSIDMAVGVDVEVIRKPSESVLVADPYPASLSTPGLTVYGDENDLPSEEESSADKSFSSVDSQEKNVTTELPGQSDSENTVTLVTEDVELQLSDTQTERLEPEVADEDQTVSFSVPNELLNSTPQETETLQAVDVGDVVPEVTEPEAKESPAIDDEEWGNAQLEVIMNADDPFKLMGTDSSIAPGEVIVNHTGGADSVLTTPDDVSEQTGRPAINSPAPVVADVVKGSTEDEQIGSQLVSEGAVLDPPPSSLEDVTTIVEASTEVEPHSVDIKGTKRKREPSSSDRVKGRKASKSKVKGNTKEAKLEDELVAEGSIHVRPRATVPAESSQTPRRDKGKRRQSQIDLSGQSEPALESPIKISPKTMTTSSSDGALQATTSTTSFIFAPLIDLFHAHGSKRKNVHSKPQPQHSYTSRIPTPLHIAETLHDNPLPLLVSTPSPHIESVAEPSVAVPPEEPTIRIIPDPVDPAPQPADKPVSPISVETPEIALPETAAPTSDISPPLSEPTPETTVEVPSSPVPKAVPLPVETNSNVSSTDHHSVPSPARQIAQTQPTSLSTRSTRSQCRYHKISLPKEEGGSRIHFLVPGCSLSNQELIKEQEIEDHGLATIEDSVQVVQEIDSLDLDQRLIGILRQLVGLDILREQEVYYRPYEGDQVTTKTKEIPRRYITERPGTGRRIDYSPSYAGSAYSGSTRSPNAASKAPVSFAGSSSSSVRRRLLDPSDKGSSIAATDSEGSDAEDGRKQSWKGTGSSPFHEDNHLKEVVAPTKGKKQKRATVKGKMENKSYKPPKEEEHESADDQPSKKKRRKSSGVKRGLKRSRTAVGESTSEPADGRKSKKLKMYPTEPASRDEGPGVA